MDISRYKRNLKMNVTEELIKYAVELYFEGKSAKESVKIAKEKFNYKEG